MEGALMAKKKTRKKLTTRQRPKQRTSAKMKKAVKPAKKPEPALATSVAAQLPDPTSDEIKAAQRHFALSLVARGQAVPKGTPLPPGATHEIVGYDEEGTPLVERKRFSLRG
jgi:hypothetical protein